MEILIDGFKLEYEKYPGRLVARLVRSFQEKPRTILFIHGFAVSFQNHVDMIEMFNAAGYDVYAINLPGHAGSMFDLNITLDRIVELIDKFIEGLWLSEVYVVGYSFGGLISLKLAEKQNKDKISRICAIAPLTYPLKLKPGFTEFNFSKKSTDVLVKIGLGAYKKRINYANVALLAPVYRSMAYDYTINLTHNEIPIRIIRLGKDEIIDGNQLTQDIKNFETCELLTVPGYAHDIFNLPLLELQGLVDIVLE